MKKFLLDSHKINYHPVAVASYIEGKKIFPINVEISPAASCNHHCLFCNFNYLGHKGLFPKGRMQNLVKELACSGVKSVVFAGIGEPLLHTDTVPSMKLAFEKGLDVGLYTNGALIKDENIEDIVNSLTFIRFSLNGGNPENYALVHKTTLKEYDTVLEKIEKIVHKKRQLASSLTIGVQFVLLPENKNFVLSQAKRMKDLGVDYFVVKHFYVHPENDYAPNVDFLTPEFLGTLKENASLLSDETFQCIIRDESHLERMRDYTQCGGLEFIAYIREDGNLYSCFAHQHDKKTILGNIFEQSFQEAWLSPQAQKAITYINECIEKNNCQANCRHHQINQYLWDLTHPSIDHINFI